VLGSDSEGLDDANLREADLTNADLANATFGRTDLTDAVLAGSNLNSATLNYAHCPGVDFGTASLLGLRACDLDVCPAGLPVDWECRDGCLPGPYVTRKGDQERTWTV